MGRILERLTFQLLVGNRDLHPAALGQKKGGQSKRHPKSKRASKRARIAESLLFRRKEKWTKLSGYTLPSRLRPFTSFRHSIPLAGYTAPRHPTVTRSLLHLPPGQHTRTCKLAALPWHQTSQREVLPVAATNAKNEAYTCVLGLLVWQ